MAEGFRRWFPFLSGASPAPGGEETAARAEEMLREAARARTPAEKERIRSRFWKSVRSGRESPEETKKRIFLNWPPAKGELRQIQQANLGLLRRFREICEKNNLSYFLLWGTLLGSVRHHGFIPWDDDIDLGLTVSDYARLRELLREDPELRVDMYYNRDYGTVCPKLKYRACEAFWLDLFLFEEIRVNEENKNDRWMQVKRLGEEWQRERLQIIRSFYPPSSPCVIPVRDERIDAEIEKLRQSHSRPDFLGGEGNALMESPDINPVFIRNLFLKEEIYPLRKDEMIFEGGRYTALRNTEAYLAAMYGNYMDLPDSLETRHSPEVEQYLARDLAALGL